MTIPKGLYITENYCEDIKYKLNGYDYLIDVNLYNINSEKKYKICKYSRKNQYPRKKNNIQEKKQYSRKNIINKKYN